MSRVPTTAAVVSNGAIMARQGSGIGYCDRKVLGARATFIEVQCNFAELCKKSRTNSWIPGTQGQIAKSRENPAKPGTVGKSATCVLILTRQNKIQGRS